jgi:hypothetical protein
MAKMLLVIVTRVAELSTIDQRLGQAETTHLLNRLVAIRLAEENGMLLSPVPLSCLCHVVSFVSLAAAGPIEL